MRCHQALVCCFLLLLAAAVKLLCLCLLQFEYGHMDFTFSAKEELGYYISGLLMRK